MFKYYLEDYCAELNGDFSTHKKNIRNFFQKNILDFTHINKHKIYIVDLLLHNKLWHELWYLTKDMCISANINLNFSEFAHTVRFAFLEVSPGDELIPHTDTNLRSMCSINIPLENDCAIDFYESPKYKDNPKKEMYNKIDTLIYTNPIILNTNNWHGVENFTNKSRLVLKVNFPIVPWNIMVSSINNKAVNRLFAFDMPWDENNVMEQLL